MKENKYELVVAVSKHELGHWFAAKEFGFNEDYIRILLRYGYDGKIYHDAYAKSYPIADLSDLDSTYTYLTRRIISLQSGVVSEFMNSSTGEVDISAVEKAIKDTASNDYKQINELVYIARGIKFSGEISKKREQEQIQLVLDECWCKAVEIIYANISKITYMSRKMGDKLMASTNGVKFDKIELQAFASDTQQVFPSDAFGVP